MGSGSPLSTGRLVSTPATAATRKPTDASTSNVRASPLSGRSRTSAMARTSVTNAPDVVTRDRPRASSDAFDARSSARAAVRCAARTSPAVGRSGPFIPAVAVALVRWRSGAGEAAAELRVAEVDLVLADALLTVSCSMVSSPSSSPLPGMPTRAAGWPAAPVRGESGLGAGDRNRPGCDRLRIASLRRILARAASTPRQLSRRA